MCLDLGCLELTAVAPRLPAKENYLHPAHTLGTMQHKTISLVWGSHDWFFESGGLFFILGCVSMRIWRSRGVPTIYLYAPHLVRVVCVVCEVLWLAHVLNSLIGGGPVNSWEEGTWPAQNLPSSPCSLYPSSTSMHCFFSHPYDCYMLLTYFTECVGRCD